jgi:hypothetical protein
MARYIAVTKRLDRMRSCALQTSPPSHAPRVAHFLLASSIADSFLSFLRQDRGREHPAMAGLAVQLPDGTVIRGTSAGEVAELVRALRC